MPRYFGALTIVLLLVMVLVRVAILKRAGIRAMNFGRLDKRDFLIPPFAFFYFYLVFAAAFGWPTVSRQQFFDPAAAFWARVAPLVRAVPWAGVAFCLVGLGLMLWSLASFGTSFRVGIDVEHPDKLVTTGAFAVSRNPIYVAFAFVLTGQFLIFSNWLLLIYLGLAVWLFHRQVLLEEVYLKQHYGSEYAEYCRRVRRYL